MPGSPTTSRRRGFSLVELVCVLSVLAVLSATAIPAVRSLGAARATQSVASVADSLRRARTGAIGMGTPCGVRIDRRNQTVELLMLDGLAVVPMPDAFGRAGEPVPVDPSGSVTIRRATGGSVAGNTPQIWFDERGGHAEVTRGGRVSPLRRDAVIRFSSGDVLRVRGISGLVE